jgi:hypothetical protein
MQVIEILERLVVFSDMDYSPFTVHRSHSPFTVHVGFIEWHGVIRRELAIHGKPDNQTAPHLSVLDFREGIPTHVVELTSLSGVQRRSLRILLCKNLPEARPTQALQHEISFEAVL